MRLKIKNSLICALLLTQAVLFAQSKVSNKSSNWSDATAWTPNGVPTATNDVVISDGTTMTIDLNANCRSITIGTGGSASNLRFTGNNPLTLSISSTFSISSTGILRLRASSNANHSINLKGNLINNGILDLGRDANSTCDVIFSNNGNQSVSGTGSQTEFDGITLNMGTSANNVLDISSTTFSAPANFLTLTNGTFKLSTNTLIAVVPFTVAPTIPASAGLWQNSASTSISIPTGVTLAGKLSVSAGSLMIGDVADEDLNVNGGSISVSAGTLNIAGKYNATGSASTFSLSGGAIIVPGIGSTNTSIAPFQITAAASQFNMTGGSLIINREGGSGAQDLGFVNTGSTGGTVSGGTLQLGSTSTPASQTISINSTYSIPNLNISSANVTAKLITNTLTVVNDITITTGTLNANSINMTLGGNWTNAGTFVSGTNTVNFISNIAQSISKTGGETFNAINFGGSGLKTLASPLTANSNFSIASGSSFDLSASNYSLNLKGNFTNNGTFNNRAALVSLTGAAAQIIGGTSVSDFYDLTLNNASGASLSSAQNLKGTLTLTSGTFNTNSKVFTMISDANGTARIAQITGGDITGNVTVQRYAPGGSTGWALMGTPISSALTLNDWDDNIFISCPTCPDGSAAGFQSIYTYSESVPGLYDAAASYVPLNTINDPITAGKGYWVYLGNGQVNTSAITLDVTGSVRKSNYTIPLSFTNNGSSADDGWNLICNPYPSAISWSSLRGATANLDNAIYVFNTDLNSGAGSFASYVNGVSSPAVGSGGIGDVIPMGQGFYVHSTGATGINAQESNKVAGNPTFLKTASSTSTASLLRLVLRGINNYSDESVLYTDVNAGVGFDVGLDAYKLIGQNPNAATIAFEELGQAFQIDAVAPISGNYTIAVKALTGISGTYSISSEDITAFPKGVCITLFDKYTNISTDLKTHNYVCTLSDTTTLSRFVLSITNNTLSAITSVSLATCQAPNAGRISAVANVTGPRNYYWSLNGASVRSAMNFIGPDTLTGINGGEVTLEISSPANCASFVKTFNLAEIIIPVADFTNPDTLFLEKADTIKFFNISQNSVFSTWNFQNSWFSYQDSPTQHYTVPGTYTVNLTCKSTSSCTSSKTKTVTVMADLTALNTVEKETGLLLIKNLGNKHFILEQKFNSPQSRTYKVTDLTGKLIKDAETITSDIFSVEIDLSNEASGIYLVQLIDATQIQTLKLFAN